MKFVADESVDRPIVVRMRQVGHQVWYVAEMDSGISDDAVLNLANREMALLLTADKEFGEMVFRQRRFTGGILLIRLAGLSATRKTNIVVSILEQHISELPASFAVIAPGIFRIRRLID